MRKMTAFLLAAVLLCMCGCGAREDVELAEPVQEQILPTPTEAPTEAPTEVPTEVPTEAPTEAPAEVPAESPTPTQIPNLTPVLTPAPIESMSPPPAISEANTGGVRKSPVTGEDDSIY